MQKRKQRHKQIHRGLYRRKSKLRIAGGFIQSYGPSPACVLSQEATAGSKRSCEKTVMCYDLVSVGDLRGGARHEPQFLFAAASEQDSQRNFSRVIKMERQ